MSVSRLLICILVHLCLGSQLFGVPKAKKTPHKTPVIIVVPKTHPARIKLNAHFGFNFLSGSAVVSGFQFGRLISSTVPVYVGPEIGFMLFSPGSILNVLVGGWIETHVFKDPQKTLDFGLFLGPGFSSQRPNWKTTALVVMTDITYTREVDESLSFRAQIRPGVVDGKVLAGLNFNAQFRFP